MKTLILSLIFLGLSTQTFSQNEVAVNDLNPNIKLTKLKNQSNAITTNKVSKRITNFQNEVSKYDIKSEPIFTPNIRATYTVVFKEAKNVITNIYNHEGEVISSEQNFEGLRLPKSIIFHILKNYPNWSIKSAKYTIKYKKSMHALATYKIKINKGAKTKTIKIEE